ncbi:MAG: metallophosphoesterase family protein [Coriobacteriia bacterium]|nr:metallophosphoesterase family protein [Coriobacteriia bacterium]MCL2871026.1 metallophosphoesterase family protein [Coriobacteriia bacterium]
MMSVLPQDISTNAKDSHAKSVKLGILSDTHGYLPDAVLSAFEPYELCALIHAGDVESEQTLWQLEQIAPVIAVRGNCDFQPELQKLPFVEKRLMGNALLVITHKPSDLRVELRRLSPQEHEVEHIAGIHGHTHVPRFEQDFDYRSEARSRANKDTVNKGTNKKADITILCPGSPVEPRKGSSPSIAVLTLALAGSQLPPQVEFIEL